MLLSSKNNICVIVTRHLIKFALQCLSNLRLRLSRGMGLGVVIAGDEGCVKDSITAMRNAFSPNIRAREIVWIFLFKYGFCSNLAMFGYLNGARSSSYFPVVFRNHYSSIPMRSIEKGFVIHISVSVLNLRIFPKPTGSAFLLRSASTNIKRRAYCNLQ